MPESPNGPTPLVDLQMVRAEVSRRLSPERFAHTERVTECALDLAARWGVSAYKAELAALLHDVAKEMPKNSLLKASLDFGIVLTKLEAATPALIHAPLGAAVARREFGVEDEDVLAAIRYHTTGRPGMSTLEKVVFIADYVEPGRTFPGVEEVRGKVFVDLDAAVLAALDQSIVYLVQKARPIAPEAVLARNELLLQTGG